MIAFATFDPAAMHQKYVVPATYQMMGMTGSEARRVDDKAGDGILIGYASMWQLLRWNPNSNDFTALGFYENGYGAELGGGGLAEVSFAQFDPRGPLRIVALEDSGSVGVFDLDGSPRGPLWRPALHDEKVWRMYVANIDGQAGDEIVFRTLFELTAWKFGASEPLWRIPMNDLIEPVLFAQLDDDPGLELVLGSGTVRDAKTLQIKWQNSVRFGWSLTAADIDGNGNRKLIACDGGLCRAFDVVHHSVMWETSLPEAAGGLAVADVRGDGKQDLFTTLFNSIRKIDGRTGAILQTIEVPGGPSFILTADVGECRKALLWGTGGGDTGPDRLHLADAVTMKTVWTGVHEEIGSSGIAVADFSGTGHPSIFWSSDGGSVQRFVSFNPRTHFEHEFAASKYYFTRDLSVTAAAHFENSPSASYILPYGENTISAASIGVYDGITHKVKWSLNVIPEADAISSLTVGDLNGDGTPDILVGSGINYWPANHNEGVVAIDGQSHKILWRTTDPLGHVLDPDLCTGCVFQLKVADLELSGVTTVLALVPTDGLFAFDGRTGALLWHSWLGFPPADLDKGTGLDPRATAFTVADVDPSPGAEIIALLTDGRLAVFDSKAANILRSKDLLKFGFGFAVEVADLDGDGIAEIIILSDAGLLVLSSQSLEVLWSGGFILPRTSYGNQIAIGDVDGDSTPEIVVSSAHSLRVFEYRRSAKDEEPPVFANTAISISASAGCCQVTLLWDQASDAASMPVRYRVYKSTVPAFMTGPTSLIAEVTETEFIDRNLVHGQTFYYAVTAVDNAGNENREPLRTFVSAPSQCPDRRRAVH